MPASEITIQNSILIHAKSNRRLAFAAVVPTAAKLPVPKDADLHLQAEERLEVRRQGARDLRPARHHHRQGAFGIDTFREGMVYASIEHPPVVGGTVKSLDDKAALAVKGVRQTVTLPAPSRRSCSSRSAASR